MTRAGWRRCDAEHVDVVRRALAHAHDPVVVRGWAARAADALEHEPVLAGAIHYLAEREGAATAAWRLLLATAPEQRLGPAAFTLAVMDRVVLEEVRRARARAVAGTDIDGPGELTG